jgi:hypothetical protein
MKQRDRFGTFATLVAEAVGGLICLCGDGFVLSVRRLLRIIRPVYRGRV